MAFIKFKDFGNYDTYKWYLDKKAREPEIFFEELRTLPQ